MKRVKEKIIKCKKCGVNRIVFEGFTPSDYCTECAWEQDPAKNKQPLQICDRR